MSTSIAIKDKVSCSRNKGIILNKVSSCTKHTQANKNTAKIKNKKFGLIIYSNNVPEKPISSFRKMLRSLNSGNHVFVSAIFLAAFPGKTSINIKLRKLKIVPATKNQFNFRSMKKCKQ